MKRWSERGKRLSWVATLTSDHTAHVAAMLRYYQ